jgi:hypothetical protein
MWLPTCLANEPPTTRIPKHGRSLEDGDGNGEGAHDGGDLDALDLTVYVCSLERRRARSCPGG